MRHRRLNQQGAHTPCRRTHWQEHLRQRLIKHPAELMPLCLPPSCTCSMHAFTGHKAQGRHAQAMVPAAEPFALTPRQSQTNPPTGCGRHTVLSRIVEARMSRTCHSAHHLFQPQNGQKAAAHGTHPCQGHQPHPNRSEHASRCMQGRRQPCRRGRTRLQRPRDHILPRDVAQDKSAASRLWHSCAPLIPWPQRSTPAHATPQHSIPSL